MEASRYFVFWFKTSKEFRIDKILQKPGGFDAFGLCFLLGWQGSKQFGQASGCRHTKGTRFGVM